MVNNLWGPEFTIQDNTKKIIKKSKSPKKVKTASQVIKSKSVSIDEKLKVITENVKKILGGYESNTEVINDINRFHEYITHAISNKVIAIDTETNNSLDTISCKLMGACIYTPGETQVYIPINHIDKNTGEKLSNQLTEKDIKKEFDRLSDIKILMHNGKFDYEVLKNTCDLDLNIYWDTMIGAKILDENEKSAGLKQQYIEKIDPSIEKYSIDHLFNIEYAVVDPDIFALYAATDAYMTYRLYEWQKQQFNKPGNEGLYNVFMNIEMPVLKVTATMELNGVCIDEEYSKRLSVKYHKKEAEVNQKITEELNKYKDTIAKWRTTEEANFHPKANNKTGIGKSKSEQLNDPVEVSSPTQLSILLYDVLKIKPVSKKSPRGTGEAILKKIDLPLCDLILEQRGINKLINTYIDKLPECVSPVDNRLHAHFNQCGTGTGRFSSSDPNLQNIPSHNADIRMMFTASQGYTMIGADYSQQEPRLLSYYSQDENMIEAYKDGKDLYAMIASKVYHNNYEDNKEFYPDGRINAEGKKRRTSVKGLLLGIMYGMQDKAISERLGVSLKEATAIKRSFFNEFPKVERWINNTEKNAIQTGYVEDAWGRRRRLPDLKLPPYEVKIDSRSGFNPLLNTSGEYVSEELNEKSNRYLSKLKSCNFYEKDDIIKEAKQHGINIRTNIGFINRAKRQCVNARIQGGAASMSKRAMINVYNCKELKDLGFRLLIAVHDELIGECPEENKERCKELLAQCMTSAALPEVTVPFKCDADDFKSWYLDVYTSDAKKEYEGYLTKYSKDVAFKKLCESREECTPEQLKQILN